MIEYRKTQKEETFRTAVTGNLKILFLLLFAFASLLTQTSGIRAERTLTITPQIEEYPLGLYMDILEDPAGKLTFDDIRSGELESRFQHSTESVPNFGMTRSAHWLRWHWDVHTELEEEWLLVMAYPDIEQIILYVPVFRDGKEIWEVRHSGRGVSALQREILHYDFIFRVRLIPGTTQHFYMRIASEDVSLVPLVLRSTMNYWTNIAPEIFAFGICYGIIFVMILYNAFIFLSVRDTAYLYYILYLAGYALFQLCVNGMAFPILWPDSPWWANHSTAFFSGLAMALGLQFCRTFLRTARRAPRLDIFLKSAAIICASLLPLSLVLPYHWAIGMASFMGIVLAVTVVSAGFHALLNGYRPARFFLTAWGALLIGIVLLCLLNFGFLPASFITLYGIQVGAVAESVLLSLALADRINLMRAETAQAQSDALENLQRMDRLKDNIRLELEQKVIERTAVIQSQNQVLEQQMTMAKRIQMSLLPQNIPDVRGVKIAYRYQPMMQIGGDFLDIHYSPSENSVGLFVCDVSGHGVPAALLASMTKMSLSFWHENLNRPAESIAYLHETLHDKLSDYFLTASICSLNLNTGELIAANAGHWPILIMRKDASLTTLRARGRMIMARWAPECESVSAQLQSGDRIVIYTDGLLEETNRAGEMFGEDRFLQLVRNHSSDSVDVMCEEVVQEVLRYSGGPLEQGDDITLLVAEYG